MEVLITIAQKCDVSLDWLCGISALQAHPMTTMGDIAEFLYQFVEFEEIGFEVERNDRVFNDIEDYEKETLYVRLTFFDNDPRYSRNNEFCYVLRRVLDTFNEFRTHFLSKEFYDMAKEKDREYYTLPLSKIEVPELSSGELMKARRDYLESEEAIYYKRKSIPYDGAIKHPRAAHTVTDITMPGIFDTDEQIYINSITKGMTKRKRADRIGIVEKIRFALQGVGDEMQEFTAGVYEKILQMTDDDWSKISAALPFQLMYDEEDIPPYDGKDESM